jgi:ABC-type branched-subunit amino acid transport system substrate-binding protein
LPHPLTPTDVTIASTTVDVRPEVAELLSGRPDCVFIDAPQQITLPAVQAISASGQTPKVAIFASTAPVNKMKQLGAAADGVYGGAANFLFPGTSQAADKFEKAFYALSPNGEFDTNAMEAYSAVYIFAAVGAHLTNFSPAKVLAAMNSAKNLKTPIMDTISSFPGNGGVPGFPRISLFNFYDYQWENGTYKAISKKPLNIRKYVIQAYS